MNQVLEEFAEKKLKEGPIVQEGLMWLTMLIRFRTDGKCEIVRSFTKPAADSKIKGLTKPKKEPKTKIDIDSIGEEKSLF